MYYLTPLLIRNVVLFLILSCSVSSDLNRLVMDYLVTEGYTAAAEEFCKEAELGRTMPVDFELVESRMNIKRAIQRGDIKEAIEQVNDLNPEVSFEYQDDTMRNPYD